MSGPTLSRKIRRWEVGRVTLLTLKERYPLAFEPVRPLAIGACGAIIEATPDLGKQLIRAALAAHCNKREYLQACLQESHRVNLDGSQAEELRDADRDYARRRLAEKEARTSGLIPRPAPVPEPAPAKPVAKPEPAPTSAATGINAAKPRLSLNLKPKAA